MTATGVEPESFADYRARFQGVFRNALGADLDLASETPQGQVVSGFALIGAEWDEALVAVANGFSRSRALGQQQDDLNSLLGIPRLDAARSTVTVTLTGTATTVVSKGSRARTSAGVVFRLTAAATIGSGGTVSAAMESVDEGPLAAAAGALTTIVDLVPGWTAVTNAAAASLGRLVETEVAYRARSGRLLNRNARSSLDAILAAVLDVAAVTDAAIHENATAAAVTTQGITIDARSFLVIAESGTDAAVGAAIAAAKPAGVAMSGATTVNVPRSSGSGTTAIKFSRVTDVPLAITVDITIGTGFPGDGSEQIVERLVGWFVGDWASGTGDFDTSGLGIGEVLDVNRLLSPILSVPGHVIVSVTPTVKADSSTPGTPDLNQRYTLAAADVTIS